MQSEKEKVALGSIAASAGLTLAKGVVGFLTGSLAILSEAAHSLIDFGATVMTYFAVRISGKPADEEHHYGHGKVESVTALAETALLFVLSGVVIWEAVKRLLGEQGHVVEATVAARSISECAASDRIASEPVSAPTTPFASVSPADAAIEVSATFCLSSDIEASPER